LGPPSSPRPQAAERLRITSNTIAQVAEIVKTVMEKTKLAASTTNGIP